MKCPFCGSFEDQVLDSRPIEHTSAIKRRRECKNCKKRYTTYERPEEVSLTVVKSDSRRESFDRKKLREGIARACEKRPISSETIDKIVTFSNDLYRIAFCNKNNKNESNFLWLTKEN